jgi:hypothetical protein
MVILEGESTMGKRLILLSVVAVLAGFSPGLRAELTYELEVWYPFNGNGNGVSPDTTSGPPGTVEGASLTIDRFGITASAYAFDGVDDRIILSDLSPLIGKCISIQVWFRTDSLRGTDWTYDRPMVWKRWAPLAWPPGGFYLGGSGADDQRVEFTLFRANHRAVSDTPLNDNQWHQAVGVYDGTLPFDNVKLYIDGQLQLQKESGLTSNLEDDGEPIAIGADIASDGTSSPNAHFRGALDDVAIYHRALTPAEVSQLYTLPHDPGRPVHRFWSPLFNHHFYTVREAERDKLINNYPHVWMYEGIVYKAFLDSSQPGVTPIYRFWSDALKGHFYTIRTTERDKLISLYSHVWTYEGVALYAYPEGSQPAGAQTVYRFWSARYNSHFYTIRQSERDYLVKTHPLVWIYEGVAWYTPGLFPTAPALAP